MKRGWHITLPRVGLDRKCFLLAASLSTKCVLCIKLWEDLVRFAPERDNIQLSKLMNTSVNGFGVGNHCS